MTEKDLFIKMTIDGWNDRIARVNKLLGELSDDQLQGEISPGRNTGTYLLGHLAAVHDMMIPLLDLGAATIPEWHKIFVESPDRAHELPPATEIRSKWNEVNEELGKRMSQLTADGWFQRHTSVSPEDFAKEPHRNKLNILLSRTTHLSYHWGQMALLKR